MVKSPATSCALQNRRRQAWRRSKLFAIKSLRPAIPSTISQCSRRRTLGFCFGHRRILNVNFRNFPQSKPIAICLSGLKKNFKKLLEKIFEGLSIGVRGKKVLRWWYLRGENFFMTAAFGELSLSAAGARLVDPLCCKA